MDCVLQFDPLLEPILKQLLTCMYGRNCLDPLYLHGKELLPVFTYANDDELQGVEAAMLRQHGLGSQCNMMKLQELYDYYNHLHGVEEIKVSETIIDRT